MIFPDDIQTQFNDNEKYKRLIVPFEDTSDRFKFHSQNDYSRQFAHIYSSRLQQMRGLLTERCKDKWGKCWSL